MTIYAVANEQDSFQQCPHPNFNTNAVSSADYNIATRFGGNARVHLGTSVSECWVHFSLYRIFPGVGSTTFPFLTLYNSSTGKDAFRIYNTATTAYFSCRYNSAGTTYTTIASGASNTTNAVISVDLYFKRGASGALKLFVDRQLRIDTTGTYNTVDTTWDYLTLTGFITTMTWEYSNIIVSDVPMFDWEYQTLRPSAAGAVSGWTGDYTDLLDNAGKIDATSAVFTDTASDSFTMSYENMVTPQANHDIKAVAIAASGSIDSAASISNIALYARHASTNYTLNNIGASAGNGPVRYSQVMELNPVSAQWSESDVNAIEFGGITS